MGYKNKCDCKACLYGREVLERLEQLPEEHKKFFEDMYKDVMHLETDVAFYKGQLTGSIKRVTKKVF